MSEKFHHGSDATATDLVDDLRMTSSSSEVITRAGTVRTVVFRALVIVWLALFAFAIPNLLTPWVDMDFQQDGVIQGWRDAVEGAVDTLVWVAVLGLAMKPRSRHVVVQLLIAVSVIAATVIPAAGAGMLITIGLVLLPVLSYPRPTLLGDLRAPDLNVTSVVIAVVAAAVLLPMAVAVWSAGESQAATYAEHLAVLAVAGLLMSFRLPGWQWVAWPTVATWVYLGVVAVAFPSDLNSFGRVGGAACLVVGIAFAAAGLRSRAGEVRGAT